MKVVFYRYGSICEPDIITIFKKNNLSVIEVTAEITNKDISSSQRVKILDQLIQSYHPLFVFSINFFPAIAEICYIHKIFYLCWTVDAPIPELFSSSILHNTNRIFMFDKTQFNYFAPYNPSCIYHLPLASATERFDNVVSSISASDKHTFNHDICFVGSLYNEKNPLADYVLSGYTTGYIKGVIASAEKIYGYNFIEELMNDTIISDMKKAGIPFYPVESSIRNSDYHIAAHQYIGMQLAVSERMHTLNTLAKFFKVDLYTHSDSSMLNNVCVHRGVKTLTEMPKVFHLSKINLNMTIKPIQTGLPLRIFDILGCGGFLLTNYQSETTEHFTIGNDLETYSSMDELIEKVDFYLNHDDLRKKIANNGYEKVKKMHTYQHRITDMLRLILQ